MSRYFFRSFTNVRLLCFVSHSNDMTSCQSSSIENVSCNVAPFFYHHSVVIQHLVSDRRLSLISKENVYNVRYIGFTVIQMLYKEILIIQKNVAKSPTMATIWSEISGTVIEENCFNFFLLNPGISSFQKIFRYKNVYRFTVILIVHWPMRIPTNGKEKSPSPRRLLCLNRLVTWILSYSLYIWILEGIRHIKLEIISLIVDLGLSSFCFYSSFRSMTPESVPPITEEPLSSYMDMSPSQTSAMIMENTPYLEMSPGQQATKHSPNPEKETRSSSNISITQQSNPKPDTIMYDKSYMSMSPGQHMPESAAGAGSSYMAMSPGQHSAPIPALPSQQSGSMVVSPSQHSAPPYSPPSQRTSRPETPPSQRVSRPGNNICLVDFDWFFVF